MVGWIKAKRGFASAIKCTVAPCPPYLLSAYLSFYIIVHNCDKEHVAT